jgi:hypothetical protein
MATLREVVETLGEGKRLVHISGRAYSPFVLLKNSVPGYLDREAKLVVGAIILDDGVFKRPLFIVEDDDDEVPAGDGGGAED